MVENVCVTVSNYATEALQDTLNFYGKEGFSLVSTQMASDKYGNRVMYLFFVRQTGEKWQPPTDKSNLGGKQNETEKAR